MRGFAGALVMLTAALPAVAAEQVYLCTVNAGAEDGAYISEEYAFLVDAEAGVVVISDPLILYFNDGQPMEAKLGSATAAKTTFSWGVFVVNSAGQRTRMAYRAVLFTQDNAFSVSARPTGYDNIFSARGNCAPG